MAKQGDSLVAQKLDEQKLWSIRHWCADVSLSLETRLLSDVGLHLDTGLHQINEQEAGLIAALRKNDRDAAHLIYADWLDERGLGSAATAHRLAATGFEWRNVSSFVCFMRNHIFGMYQSGSGFLEARDKVGLWIVPMGFIGTKVPHAEYVGSFDFRTLICRIYEVSWELRDLQLSQKEPS